MNALARMTFALLAMMALIAPAAAADRQINVYMYSEYIDPQIPEQFEKLTGIRCRIDVYENSEEMLAKVIQGGGDRQYDVLVISDAHVPTLIKLGMVQPLNKTLLPNAANVDEMFANPPFDPDLRYSLPYQWGTVGLIYDTDKVKTPISWSLIFQANKQTGPFILIDSMRDMLGIALKYKGHSMNSTDPAQIKEASDAILLAKKSRLSLGFEGGVGGKNRVQAGEAAMAVTYNGDALRAIDESDNLGFAIPAEGGIIWVDVMLIPAKAPNTQAAHQFINYIMDPKVGAQLSNFNRYATPNKMSLPMITPADRKNPAIYPSPQVMKTLEYLVDVGQHTRLYDEAWTSVKAQ